MKNKLNSNIASFLFGFLLCSILLGIIVLFYSGVFSRTDTTNQINSDIGINNQDNIGEVTEDNTQALNDFTIDSGIKSDICKSNSLNSIDDLSDSQYEDFLIYSLQVNPGGNDILFFIRDFDECSILNRSSIVSNERIFDCKIKHTTQALINNETPNENHLSEIIALVPKFQIIVDSFTSNDCTTMESINPSLVTYCKDSDTFKDFKTKLFQKNLDTLCQ